MSIPTLVKRCFLPALVSLLAACGDDAGSPSDDADTGERGAAAATLVLATDPGNAVTVAQVRKAKNGDKVVVVGRVQEIVRGFAAFRLADQSLEYCAQHNKEDTCPTPWDYCCVPPAKVKANLIFVEARDADGKPIRATKLPGLRPVDLVAIKGTVERDARGNVTIVSSGWYRRERPEFAHTVRWPQ